MKFLSQFNSSLQNTAAITWLACLMIALLLLVDAYRVPPIEFGEVIRADVAVPGKSMTLELRGKRNRVDCEVTVTREFVDKTLKAYRAEPRIFETKRIKQFAVDSPHVIPIEIAIVPDRLKHGTGSLINTATYRCNPWHYLYAYQVQVVIPIIIAAGPVP